MKKKSLIIRPFIASSWVFILLLMTSCRKEIPQIEQPEDYLNGNFNEVFESFWNGMNNNYVFWDIDTTDWNRVYKQYKPLFAKLNLADSNDVKKGLEYFKTMTNGLVDGHYNMQYNIYWKKNTAGEDSIVNISPSSQRKVKSVDFHEPIPGDHFFYQVPRRYLDKGWSRAIVETPDGSQSYAITGIINNSILYLYVNDFALKKNYGTDLRYRGVLDNFFKHLSTTKLKGVILDVRSNSGGDLEDLDFLMGSMIREPLDFGFTRSKLNNGRLDYTPWIPAFVKPQVGATKITCPIVVLADAFSVSMAEITTMAIKALPNGHFVGERTWGAMGPLTSNQTYNGGQFTTSFLIDEVYTSSLLFKYKDGKIYEGIGFPPDVEAKYNGEALQNGEDTQLEAALSLIN